MKWVNYNIPVLDTRLFVDSGGLPLPSPDAGSLPLFLMIMTLVCVCVEGFRRATILTWMELKEELADAGSSCSFALLTLITFPIHYPFITVRYDDAAALGVRGGAGERSPPRAVMAGAYYYHHRLAQPDRDKLEAAGQRHSALSSSGPIMIAS